MVSIVTGIDGDGKQKLYALFTFSTTWSEQTSQAFLNSTLFLLLSLLLHYTSKYYLVYLHCFRLNKH
jgi:hypothetical protein